MAKSYSTTERKLKVFLSSKMLELRDVRDIIATALRDKGIDAWIFEAAGARPADVVETSLREVEDADIYVGLFWRQYGDVTVQEYQHARVLNKPSFVYIRERTTQREEKLEAFLRTEVYDPQRGVTYAYFDSAVQLGKQVADDLMTWLVWQHREMTAEIRAARVAQHEILRLQTEVDRLQASSRARLPKGTAVDDLARQMRGWFATLGYHFEGYEVRQDGYFEWIINVPARRGFDRILVRGLEGEAGLSDVAALHQTVTIQQADEGWLVATHRVSQATREEAQQRQHRHLFCYTFDELLDENADFSGYLDWLETEVSKRKIDRHYVALACTKEEIDVHSGQILGRSRYDGQNGWIDAYVDRWLADPSREHLSILGEFGTGKTWFTLHYAWSALNRYRDAKRRGVERPRLPLVIPLRDYAKAVSAESLFSEFFFRRYEIPLPSYSAFVQLNRMGKLLLIFDGFDEMAARVDRQQMINNFWELAKVVVPGSKAILTCRTEHFPEAREGRALLSAELQASTARLTGDPPQFEVLELEKLDDDQIRRVLLFQAEAGAVEQIMGNPRLLDLARRPVMIEILTEALPEIEAGKAVDLARIYLYAIKRKMERDITSQRTFTSMADKLYFLCELAWEMLMTDQMTINYRQFPAQIRRLFGPRVEEQKDLDHWHYDMMGQTLLIRNAEGDYMPAHRSLLEFLVAYKLAALLGALADDFVILAQSQSCVDSSMPPQAYSWSKYFQRNRNDKGEIISIPPLEKFDRESQEELERNLNKRPTISFAVASFMGAMISDSFVESLPSAKGRTQRAKELRQAEQDILCILPRDARPIGTEELVSKWLEETTMRLGCQSSGLSLLFEGGLVSWLVSAGSASADMPGEELSLADSVQGHALRTLQTLRVHDARATPYNSSHHPVVRSELVAPLGSDKRVSGVVHWDSFEIDRFSDADVVLAEKLIGPVVRILNEFGGFREAWQSTPRHRRAFLIPSLFHVLRSREIPSYHPMPPMPRRMHRRKRDVGG